MSEMLQKAQTFVDQAADKLSDLTDQAVAATGDLANQHGDTVVDAVTRAADFVDDKTGGKSASISTAVKDTTSDIIGALKKGSPSE
jgi:ABC-type transporter Mla subunit MlaD